MLGAIVMLALVAVAPELTGVSGFPGVVRTNGGSPMTGPEAQAKLAGTWTVVHVSDAIIPDFAVPQLVFEPERLAGLAGCNRFGAPLTYGDGGALTLGEAVTTFETCGPDAMAVEAQVLNALQLINEVSFDTDDRIRLIGFGMELMIAERNE